ncbi:dTDP-4-dehydrorhamnose reductase family protein [Geovibrio ferrireducens]|uniref:dTDP-4-dehydrorhamnose reductase family protein n=1 Tax=Geovibrio ferrireducens TaxID=46201 RepID=UPI002247622A|nr:SDR family oxidoreductase [Geovibrio ferrireducens]
MKVLILGGSGMLGHKLWQILSNDYQVYISLRRSNSMLEALKGEKMFIRHDVDALNFDSITRALASIEPDIVINCIGLIKQLPIANDPLSSITINSQLPHRLSLICKTAKIRLIHISTDCVFSGSKGNYVEDDDSDAKDLYGRSKYLGEVYYPHTVTLRTSIIGHELGGHLGLVDWFLKQKGSVRGFSKAIFSGFSTLELAKIIREHVIENTLLSGLYHVSTQPVSKFHLLEMINKVYKTDTQILPFDGVDINRSMCGSRFIKATGYSVKDWDTLIYEMYEDYCKNKHLYIKY